ncbi:MAG TPA: PadR family transcriptional regulator [Steroidobacteraceae bacterium]|nr:PadR family transcriptional regulator [Steroidobacteraceae bacterium]
MARDRRSSAPTLALFAALLERPRAWQYGYELSQLTQLKSGTLYPILIRLTDRGLLESRWQPSAEPGRPPRHMYKLTAAGAVFARDEIHSAAGSPHRPLSGAPA